MNLDDAQQRIRWVTFSVLAGAAILLTLLDSTGNLNSALNFLRDPMAFAMSWTSFGTDTVVDVLTGPRDVQAVRAENEALRARIAELERELEEQREMQGEYQILLDLFNRSRETPNFGRQAASVIGHDTNPAIRSIIIDKGSADGIQVGMPAESARGLVGQVFRTTASSAQIILITDNASSIPARLGSSRATGNLIGGGPGGSLVMEWIDLKYQIEVGEVVLTSGLAGKIPQDVVIGRVIEVDRSEAELFQRVVVQSAVDFEALEIVFVITDFEPVDTEVFNTSPSN